MILIVECFTCVYKETSNRVSKRTVFFSLCESMSCIRAVNIDRPEKFGILLATRNLFQDNFINTLGRIAIKKMRPN